MIQTQNVGIYIHAPFCLCKCPYCDFYSVTGWEDSLLDQYTNAVITELQNRRTEAGTGCADTLYFGGGTPSLLGGARIARLIEQTDRIYSLQNAEITLEVNPGDRIEHTLCQFSAAGGNRLSIGAQSPDNNILRFLGRRHRHEDTVRMCGEAADAGITNLSVDVMLGLPGQDEPEMENLAKTALNLGASHVSAYLLKIEPSTPFYSRRHELGLPDDDAAAELYLSACRYFKDAGFAQYEISNFARNGCQSRHNLKYWNAMPAIGIGPAAHSFTEGRRRRYPPDLEGFINGCAALFDDDALPSAGSEDEYIMLRLRLIDGVDGVMFKERFGHPLPQRYYERAAALPKNLVQCSGGIRFTPEGFLLSNALTGRIII